MVKHGQEDAQKLDDGLEWSTHFVTQHGSKRFCLLGSYLVLLHDYVVELALNLFGDFSQKDCRHRSSQVVLALDFDAKEPE